MSIRPVKRVVKSQPTLEGAGVRLRRAFGFGDTDEFDPFLLLDDFRNENPDDYLAGFPWHPHRGIETITYVLAGTVDHGDSLGNKGSLGAGDVQWMTAGSGILHQEMPKGDPTGPHARLPAVGEPAASLKMTDAALPGHPRDGHPRGHRRRRDARARGLRRVLGRARPGGRHRRGSALPRRVRAAGAAQDAAGGDSTPRVRLRLRGLGALRGASDPQVVPTERVGARGDGAGPMDEVGNRSLVLFDRGDEVTVQAGDEGIRFLLVSGRPIEEPVAWHGPIVMNTQEELRQAFAEFRNGTFIKHK